MRRIYQVIIVAVAFCSLLAFLAYKHEYDRLKNVLQVLDTFGRVPTSKNCSGQVNEVTTSKVSFGDWRQFDSSVEGGPSRPFYLYSAFWNPSYRTVRIHGMTTAIGHDSEREWNQCAFFNDVYESPPKYKLGSLKINIDVVSNVPKWVPVTIECKTPLATSGEDSPPFAVSFAKTGKRWTPVINVGNTATTGAKDSVAICASVTDGSLVDEGTVVQFIEYHRYVGVYRFVIYADGLLAAVHRRISTLTAKYHEAHIEILPWNVPFAMGERDRRSAANVVMKRDCLDRLGQEFSHVLFLEIRELVVSRYHSHLLNFVKDEASITDDPHLGGLRLARRFFCLEFEDHPQQMPTDLFVMQYKNDLLTLPPMFTKTKWIDRVADFEPGNETYLVKTAAVQNFAFEGVPILSEKYSFPRANPEFVSIHSYVQCGSDSDDSPFEPSGRLEYDDIVIKKIKNQFL